MTLFCRQIRSREPKNVQKAKQQVYRLTIKYKYNHVAFRRRKKDHDGGRVYWRARSQCKVGLIKDICELSFPDGYFLTVHGNADSSGFVLLFT